jgi:hypothetical protein
LIFFKNCPVLFLPPTPKAILERWLDISFMKKSSGEDEGTQVGCEHVRNYKKEGVIIMHKYFL